MGAKISRIADRGRGDRSSRRVKYQVLLFHETRTPVRGKLEITADDIIFCQKGKDARVWPIRSIRRYGCEDDNFSFESGRRCPSGPGLFSFQSKEADLIFSGVQEVVGHIATLDLSARVAGSNRYEPEPVSSSTRPHSAAGDSPAHANEYLNCDSQGRPHFGSVLLEGFGGSDDTLPLPKQPEPSDIQYADLLLTPPRGSLSFSGSEDGQDTLIPAKLEFVRGFNPDNVVSYARIDATKSKAAANLNARSHS